MTPARHRAIAAQKRAKAKILRLEADRLEAHALLDEEIAKAKEALQGGERSGNVNRNMLDVHRIARSRGLKPKDPFTVAINAKGYTAASLARQLEIAPSLLSMYRTKLRPIPAQRAQRVEELTGWAATPKNWPGGIS